MRPKIISDPLNIFVVANGCPTKQSPLTGIFELDQAKSLAALGHSVTFLAIDLRSIRHPRKFGLSSWTEDGVNILVYSFPLGRVPLSLEKTVGILCAKKLYAKAIKMFGIPDVIHGHFALQGIFAREIKTDQKTVIAYTEHCSHVMREDKSYCSLMKEACEAADIVIAVSSALAKKMDSWISSTPTVIGNISDTKVFETVPHREHQSFNIVSVGSLIPLKNHALLIKAFTQAKERTSNAMTLTIFGEGPERANLETLIASLDLADCVTLKGLCVRDEIARAFETADCLVHASNIETFGVVCIEALSAGVPVIATRCGGPEDVVTPSVGLLVPPQDPDALAEAILAIASDKATFSPEELRQYVADNFSHNAIGSQLEKEYRKAFAQLN